MRLPQQKWSDSYTKIVKKKTRRNERPALIEFVYEPTSVNTMLPLLPKMISLEFSIV